MKKMRNKLNTMIIFGKFKSIARVLLFGLRNLVSLKVNLILGVCKALN